jgi:4-aminobutyrate aminotransferase
MLDTRHAGQTALTYGAPVPAYPKIVVPPPGPKARAVVERDEAWTSTCYIKEYPLVAGRG